MRTRLLVILAGLGGLAVAAYHSGFVEPYLATFAAKHAEAEERAAAKSEAPVPAVSVVQATKSNFVETVLVTGSFVAREEILVAPEVDGLRVLELKAEEGDRVKKGDVLAILVTEQIEAQLAANEGALVSATAAIERAKSQIAEMEARVAEADAQLERARPLVKDKFLSESVFDQRQAAARAAHSQLAFAKGSFAQAEAEKVQVEAQRRELLWRRGRAEVRAPADGLISRRSARIGGLALANALAGGDTMFRIIENGEVELDAEVAETHLHKVKVGQPARVVSSGGTEVSGTVRLVSPEVDKTTRLGHVRIFLGANPDLKIGSFGRGTIETSRGRTIAVPLSAVLYSEDGASVQAVVEGKVVTRKVKTGLETAGMIAIESGLSEGDVVVAKAGTFLRDGDAVRAVQPAAKISEAGQ
ncbi:MAG TPA: efflux RND transporter periplasmic adaptor subunit [Hyphomicrobium zavarzinii]|jgi:RND family efflux transporter MFP subunit|uniref:efflux RND transporter periplasmic adaptor subunit n=1 Tax=Hyphomicrobium sp. DMF-1 TaxID=3019544 RepID=UPI0022EBE6BF|nr:efflux RND transporter periplasmic adaptor subunit [Hyphomicrobium sp. DMF-1]WBT38256.1 efflux RND transporter periplasmic adaptor subunit [Hyphomicrobium sp. DMF-1]HML43553.1 efflux RND transporter periplasmic adaptor subunit [Hyphomicrobium zavarzinii]